MLKALVVQLLEELQKANARLERQEHHMDLLLKRIYGSTSEKFLRSRVCCLILSRARQRLPQARWRRLLHQGFPRSGTSTVAAAFPTSSDVRKSFMIFRKPRWRRWVARKNLMELPPERSEQARLAALDAVGDRACPQKVRPQGTTAGKRADALGTERSGGQQAGPSDSRRFGRAGADGTGIVSKGADHLPLHRLEGIFKRQGLRISRQTMDGWWLQTANSYDLCTP